MAYYCIGDPAVAMKAAQEKICNDFVVDQNRIDIDMQLKMTLASFAHSNYCKRVIWSPNAEKRGAMMFPTGFQFTVDRRSPVLPSLFADVPFGATILAFPLDAGYKSSVVVKTGEKVSEEFFSLPTSSIAASLVKTFGTSNRLGSDDTNFTGFFSTQTRTESGYVDRVWCVTQAHSDEINEKIQAMIAAAVPRDMEASINFAATLDSTDATAAPPHTTWHDLFSNNTEMHELLAQQRKYCATQLARTIKAAGLGPVAASKDSEDNILAILNNEQVVETQRNIVDHVGGDLAFLSEMTSVHGKLRNGTLIIEKPTLGPTILPAAWSNDRVAETGLVGFPSSVGRVESVDDHNMKIVDAKALQQTSRHVWDASGSPLNTNLSPMLFNTRTTQWRAMETALGIPKQTEVNLKPVLVCMQKTAQPVV